MSPLPQKVDLLRWVEDQTQLDPVSKYLLEKLARFADAEGCAWAKIDTLAQATNCSARTVQTRMRSLETLGLIENTGRAHRLKHSTRSVPIYQLAPEIEGFGLPVSMGAEFAPIDVHGCKDEGGMGATVCTRIGLKGTEGESYDSPVRERARERACFADLEAAYPKAGLKITDRETAWIALCVLADAGVEVERLADCARAMAADPAMGRRDFGPPSMQAWMSRGQYRGWWPDDPAAAVAAPAPVAVAHDAIPEVVASAIGLSFIGTWAVGATWRESDRTLIVRLGVQADRFRNEKRALLTAIDVRVISAGEAQSEQLVGVER